LADTNITNFGRCTDRQICWTLPVVADNESLVKVVDDWKHHLDTNSDVDQDKIKIVTVDAFGCACFQVFVLFYTKQTAWLPFMEVKEKVILEFNHIIGKNGCKFGVPTTAVILNNAPK